MLLEEHKATPLIAKKLSELQAVAVAAMVSSATLSSAEQVELATMAGRFPGLGGFHGGVAIASREAPPLSARLHHGAPLPHDGDVGCDGGSEHPGGHQTHRPPRTLGQAGHAVPNGAHCQVDHQLVVGVLH
jgi:hypothetical protein